MYTSVTLWRGLSALVVSWYTTYDLSQWMKLRQHTFLAHRSVVVREACLDRPCHTAHHSTLQGAGTVQRYHLVEQTFIKAKNGPYGQREALRHRFSTTRPEKTIIVVRSQSDVDEIDDILYNEVNVKNAVMVHVLISQKDLEEPVKGFDSGKAIIMMTT